MNTPRIVIAGAGTAGHHLAAALRESGFDGAVSLIGDEPHLPYHRPPLSKDYLAGTAHPDSLSLRAPAFYTEHKVATHLGIPVRQIDRTTHRVVLADDRPLAYDHLVLALGASPGPSTYRGGTSEVWWSCAPAPTPNAPRTPTRGLPGGSGRRWIHRTRGCGRRPQARRRCHRSRSEAHFDESGPVHHRRSPSRRVAYCAGRSGGLLDCRVRAGRQCGARIRRHHHGRQRLAADVVVLGSGVVPNVAPAAAAGLDVANGVVVDEYLTTSDPRISAVGDCANFPAPCGDRIRLESIQNAVDQARYVARRINGHTGTYSAVPYFWSDQFGMKLQIVGHAARSDRTVIRGTDTKFSIFRFHGDELAAVESINDPMTHLTVRKILGAGGTLTPDQADETVDLRALARNLAG